MINKNVVLFLALTIISRPLFASEEECVSKNITSISLQQQETKHQQNALKEGIIWEDFRPNSPGRYEDIYTTYKIYAKNNNRGLIWQNVWRCDQVALQKIISKHWYDGYKLAKLMQLVIMPMVKQKSPVATKILRDLLLRDEIGTHSNGNVNLFLQSFLISEANKGDQRFQLKVLEAYAFGEFGISPRFKKNRKFAREKLCQYAIVDQNPKAQVFFIDAFKKGYFGLRKQKVGNRKTALYFLKEFAKQGNETVQMYRVYAYAEGWFGIDSTLSKNIQRTLNLATHYAYQGNREAQEFLERTYANGELNTRKDKNRFKKLAKIRDEFNLWPESFYKIRNFNPYQLLPVDEVEEDKEMDNE
jgi:hypothetical protein